jgi:RHS repeat-associated protein
VGSRDTVADAGVACAAVPGATYPAAAISDTRTTYDNEAWDTAPTVGNATSTQIVDGYTGAIAASATWVPATATVYDSMGRATSVTNDLKNTSTANYTTTTAYTPATGGPLTKTIVTAPSPTGTGWPTTTLFNPAWGAETSTTDMNGNITTAAYDALGRRTGVWLPIRPQASNATSPSTGYAYGTPENTAGIVDAAMSVATTTLTAGSSLTAYTLYDGLGQQVQTQSGAEGSGTVITDTGYNQAGQVVLTNNAYWTTSVSPSGTLFVVANEQNVPSETVTRYDGDGRTTATVLETGGTERYETDTAYPGPDRTDVTPPTGGTPTSTFTNSLGETTKLIQYESATPGTGTAETTTYGYNVQGQMTSMTDPTGQNTWNWTYNVLGQEISAVDPDTGTTTSSYNDAGDLLSTTDANGNTLAYSYDIQGRKTAEYSGSTTGAELASWTYDTLDKGQLTSSNSYVGSTPGTPGIAYTKAITGYNADYQPSGTTISIPTGAPAFAGTSYTTGLYYNQDGSLSAQTDPAEGGLPAETIRDSYDTLGNLTTVQGAHAYTTGSAYTAIGQVAQYTRPGTTKTVYTDYGYDEATGAVDAIEDLSQVGSTLTTVADRVYGYNNAGDVTSQTTTATSVATETQCYSYDYLQNLTQAWTPASNSCATTPSTSDQGGPAPYWDTYSVDDATGNRLTSTVNANTVTGTAQSQTTYSYPTAGSADPHVVSSTSTVVGTGTGATTTASTYSVDPDGNTVSRTAQNQAFGYNAQDQLASTTTGSGASAVTQNDVYDADGDLLLQSDPTTGATLSLGDTQLHLAAGATTATGVRTYTANGTSIAQRTTTVGVTGSALYWLGTDIHGTADIEINDATGAVTRRYTDPYGNPVGANPTWSAPDTFLNAPQDPLSGLVQLGARVYDPGIGKFLSADPVLQPSDPQQNNGYSYAHNNPTTDSDPTGLFLFPVYCSLYGLCPPTHNILDIAPSTSSTGGGTGGGSGGSSDTGGGDQSSGGSINWFDSGVSVLVLGEHAHTPVMAKATSTLTTSSGASSCGDSTTSSCPATKTATSSSGGCHGFFSCAWHYTKVVATNKYVVGATLVVGAVALGATGVGLFVDAAAVGAEATAVTAEAAEGAEAVDAAEAAEEARVAGVSTKTIGTISNKVSAFSAGLDTVGCGAGDKVACAGAALNGGSLVFGKLVEPLKGFESLSGSLAATHAFTLGQGGFILDLGDLLNHSNGG